MADSNLDGIAVLSNDLVPPKPLTNRPLVLKSCCRCGIPLWKDEREARRQQRNRGIDVRFFCTRSCTTIVSNASEKRGGNARNFGEWAKAKGSGSPSYKGEFTFYLNRARQRHRNRSMCPEIDLTDAYLSGLWNEQEGRCAFSGIPLILNQGVRTGVAGLLSASLDRIDSTQPYQQGNVQFVALCLNLAKQAASDNEFRRTLLLIAQSVFKAANSAQPSEGKERN